MSGRHRKPTSSTTGVAKVAFTGAVVGGGGLAFAGHATAATDGEWDQVARCESTNNWSINTGNGFQGGLQFTPSTWSGHGGGQYAAAAHQASREQQIAVGERVLANQGRGAWPSCGGVLSGPTQRDVAAGSSTSDSPPAADESVADESAAEGDSAIRVDSAGFERVEPPFGLPKAPEGWAPFPWELPPPPENLPPPPENLPPPPENLPPPPEDLPPPPENLPPPPEDLPPPPENLPQPPEQSPQDFDEPQTPDEQGPEDRNDRAVATEAGYVDQLRQAIQSQNVVGNQALAHFA
jgi:hypothetical protein